MELPVLNDIVMVLSSVSQVGAAPQCWALAHLAWQGKLPVASFLLVLASMH